MKGIETITSLKELGVFLDKKLCCMKSSRKDPEKIFHDLVLDEIYGQSYTIEEFQVKFNCFLDLNWR